MNNKLQLFLEGNSVHYGVVDFSVVDDRTAENILNSAVKSLLFKSGDTFAIAALPLQERLNSKALQHELGSKSLRFATPKELHDITGCEPGECYPIGVVNGLDTYVDESIAAHADIFFSAGVARKVIKMSVEDFINITDPKLAKLTSNSRGSL